MACIFSCSNSGVHGPYDFDLGFLLGVCSRFTDLGWRTTFVSVIDNFRLVTMKYGTLMQPSFVTM